ncbi:PIR Superfamily Protein [Plasmodium ovale curtisi]|uniref:PIR Superfamily Protein n=2 Tax=Plasmodium ovale curtisi TaxID=864141 RepID=A0A1A8WSZ4_PLAOA|nr:PIR Superfamily Protein [Plasmodium ovale curtisi]
MSENTEDKFPELLKVDNTFWEKTDLYQFFENFSPVISNGKNTYNTCKDSNIDNGSNDCKIAESIKKIWDGKFSELNTSDKNNKYCNYLFYWMYDKIIECNSDIFCTSWLYSKFEKSWENISCCEENVCEGEGDNKELCEKKKSNGRKMCNNNFVKVFNADKIKNKNKLHQFLECYNNIKNILEGIDNDKKKSFCNYIQDMFHLYSKMNYEDKKSEFKKYSKELLLFYNTFKNDDQLSELKRKCSNLNLPKIENIESSNLLSSSQNSDEIFRPLIANIIDYIKRTPENMAEIFKDTDSYKLYEKFNAEVSGNKYDNDCVNFKNLGNTYKDESEKICKKILKNIDTFDNFENFIELHIKKEEKDLYEYFKYYNTIESIIPPEGKEKEKYKNYLDYINDLYRRRKNDWECCDKSYGVEPSCRHYFNCGEEYNPSNLIDILNGANRDSIKQKYKKTTVILFGDEKAPNGTDEKDIMKIRYGRCTKLYDPNKPEEVMGLRCDYKASYDHYKDILSKLTGEKKEDEEKKNIVTKTSSGSANGSSSVSNTIEGESNPSHFKIITSVALVLGILFIFFLYYKFTPFGLLFRKRGRRKDRFEEDFHEEYMQHLSYDSEYEDIRSSNRRLQIAYMRE